MDSLIGFISEDISNLLILAGLVFLCIAVIGRITGKIDPGPHGRIAAGALGGILLIIGLVLHTTGPTAVEQKKPVIGVMMVTGDLSAVGAEVYIDQVYKGQLIQDERGARLKIPGLLAGEHKIRVTKPGEQYQDFGRTVKVTAGGTMQVDVDLSPENVRIEIAEDVMDVVDGPESTAVPLAEPNVEHAMSNTCKFTSGPREGQTQHFPGHPAIPVGSPCQDGAGSFGVAILDHPNPGEHAMSNTCKFTSGPREGQTQHYPGHPAIPVGSPCQDGAGSFGVAIPD